MGDGVPPRTAGIGGHAAFTIGAMVSKPRILVVEDETGIADTLQYVLSTDGFAPVGAAPPPRPWPSLPPTHRRWPCWTWACPT